MTFTILLMWSSDIFTTKFMHCLNANISFFNWLWNEYDVRKTPGISLINHGFCDQCWITDQFALALALCSRCLTIHCVHCLLTVYGERWHVSGTVYKLYLATLARMIFIRVDTKIINEDFYAFLYNSLLCIIFYFSLFSC